MPFRWLIFTDPHGPSRTLNPQNHRNIRHTAMAALGSLGQLVKTAKERWFAADGKTPLIEVTDVFAAAAEGDKLACEIVGGFSFL